jgi:hypothetical protein
MDDRINKDKTYKDPQDALFALSNSTSSITSHCRKISIGIVVLTKYSSGEAEPV